MKIDNLIKSLESEIKQTQEGIEQTEALERLKSIAKVYSGDDEIVSFQEIAEQIKNTPPEPKTSSGISGIDKLMYGGFMKGTVTTISATPKSGKTSFCMYLTQKMEGGNPLWLALEESSKSLIRKLIKVGAKVPTGFSPKSIKDISMDWIESKIVESIAKNNTQIVFIDQLDFIVPQDGADGRHDLKIAQTMRDLHKMAVKWNVIIFLICHVNSMEPDVKPTTKNLRGSSAIWGESDNVILLWRECFKEQGQLVYTNNILVSLQANREDGDTGNIKMVYKNGVFEEFEWQSNTSESLKDF